MRSFNRQLDFLRKYNAHQIAHSRSTLLAHLKGTYLLLREWGNDEDTCAAGLFHSVYGTHNFPKVIIKDRSEVRAMIGEKAEHHVWLLSSIDGCNMEIHNDDTIRRLVEIEVADMVEQDARWDNYRSQQKWVRNSAKYLNYMSKRARLAYESLSL
jgi:(p)ppGpp synthase/HD superfamily hydrolase